MDVIDKKNRTDDGRPKRSLVEKAADRMGAAFAKAPGSAPIREQVIQTPPAADNRPQLATPGPVTLTPPASSGSNPYVPTPSAHIPSPGAYVSKPSVHVPSPSAAVTPSTANAGRVASSPGSRIDPVTDKRHTKKWVTLDKDRLRAAGYVLPGEQSLVAEEMRVIKRPLLLDAFAGTAPREGRSHVIMVTSALPGEGKTFTAVNLALSLVSEPDIRVLLIDADMAQTSIPGLLGFQAERGLVDVLRDPSIDLADVMVRTNYDNLSILPGGKQIADANELFASARMTQFIGEIARRYNDRVIILDSPPVLARSEPSVLAMHVGQIVFVVQAERTSEVAVREGVGMVSACKKVSLVLNRVATPIGSQQRFGHVSAEAQS